MNNLYANKLYKDKYYFYKSYDDLNIDELKLYYQTLCDNNIKTAKVIDFIQKNDKKVVIKQKLLQNLNLEEFVFNDLICNSKLSNKSLKLFSKFIKMYFKKIYKLNDIAIDCKLSNFMVKGLTLVDIVPALFYSEYNENKNSIKYVCFNKDLQIKSIIVYWLKYYIKYSYKNSINPLENLNKDFLKLKKIVEKYYTFKEFKNLNEIEKQYNKRFEILCNCLNYKSYDDFLKEFLENNFYSSLNKMVEGKNNSIVNFYLLGGTGVGKTYITTKLKTFIDYNVINLDEIYWKDDFSTPNTTEYIKDSINNKILASDNFIIEGAYLDEWVYDAFDKCDKIFILKSNYKLQRKRVIKRFIKRKLGIEKCKHKESIKSINSLLAWAKTYSKKLDDFIEKSKNNFGDKMIIIENTNEILKIILMN